MSDTVTQSQFFMWRTLFAVAHADNIVTDEEITYMAEILNGVNFTDGQTSILKDDIIHAKDVEEMFKKITNQDDRQQFFTFARELVWVDGDYAEEEQSVMIKLMEEHAKEVDMDKLIGNISMELEETSDIQQAILSNNINKKTGIINMLTSFRKIFS